MADKNSSTLYVSTEIAETYENPETEGQDDSKKLDNGEDQTSPRAVFEIPVSGTDSDHSSSSSCSSSSTNRSIPQRSTTMSTKQSHGLQWKNLIDTWKKKSVRRFSTIPMLTSSDTSRRGLRRKLARIRSADDRIDCGEELVIKPSWRSFDYEELAAATDNFSSGKNKLLFAEKKKKKRKPDVCLAETKTLKLSFLNFDRK